jgi:hypothetical protein
VCWFSTKQLEDAISSNVICSTIDERLNLAHGEVYSIQHYVKKVCQRLVAGWWFSLGTLVSSTNKTDYHDIAEILLLNTTTQFGSSQILKLVFAASPLSMQH